MSRKPPKRTTAPLGVQIDPDVIQALREFAEERDESIRSIVELAIRRHLANPPPRIEVPPLPPLSVTGEQQTPPKRKKP